MADNYLYYGDNLDVLRRKVRDESVDLCYIDPPFNSKRNYNQIYNNIGAEDFAQAQAFVDTWIWDDRASAGLQEILGNDQGRFTSQTVDLVKGLHIVLGNGSLLAYLVSMALRVTEIHRVLKPTGSFFLHCDPSASHYLKLMLDAVFLPSGGDFLNEIVWHYGGRGAKAVAQQFPRNHDVILYYSKRIGKHHYQRQYMERVMTESEARARNFRQDENGRWFKTAPRGDYTDESVQRLAGEGRIHYTRTGGIRVKYFLETRGGRVVEPMLVGDVWDDIADAMHMGKERLGYPTQKPEALLERIINATTNENDLILDAYCGCGTTVAAAQHLNRRWIGIDITYQSIALILRRLEAHYGKEALANITLDGIPRDMASAVALANKKDDRVRKEFEKWAVLTYTNNRAVINEKKGADAGVDGIAYTAISANDNAKIILQVKSGHVSRSDVATLRGDMAREGAPLATLITLEPPTAPMVAEAKAVPPYHHPLMGRNYDAIEIVTVQDIIEHGKRLDIPMSLDVLKKAERKSAGGQKSLFDAELHFDDADELDDSDE